VEYYLWKFLGGDRTEKTRASLLNCLALCSSAEDLDMCSAGLSIHQLLGSDMKWPALYIAGTALAILKGDNNFWNVQHPDSSKFQVKVTSGLIRRFQEEQIDAQQNRVGAHVLLKADVGPVDVDVQNRNGDTMLNLACQSANFLLIFELLANHGASASIANNYGEEPIHWLHQIPSEKSEVMEAITVLLARAGANVECYSPPRFGEYCHSFSNHYLFPTPLLRAVARRNTSAVSCLVRSGAEVSTVAGSICAGMRMSPLSLAASMSEYECLEVMFPYWSGKSNTNDPDNTEVNGLWESAIGGLSGRERIKLHGGQYATSVKRTLEVMTKYLGPCYLIRNSQPSIVYAVEGGDLVWVEALLQKLFSEPRKAVLTDLQRALECATEQGYKHIVKKLMEYGALPLLPHTWSLQSYTIGRPGRWNEELIDCLTERMFESGHICAKTQCSLHFCANGGADSAHIAEEILKRPVVNKCLMPFLRDANDHGLPHFVTAMIEGIYPQLDRPDEEHRTPLYNAIANGELKLAQYFIDCHASYEVDELSLTAQIFEDGRTSLPQQIKFLLDQRHRKPAFNVTRRIFGRIQRRPVLTLPSAAGFQDWILEEHTVITAMAEACRAFDDFNKKRCWLAVLEVFNTPEQILMKAGDGRDALEIAIDAADHVSLHMLVDRLKKHPKAFEDYTVIDRIRDIILAEPPPHVADSPMKKKIISYRCDLGDMMRTMLAAGDKGRNDRSDLCERILQIIIDEFPILATGFSQRGSGHESTKEFTSDAERFCNALVTAFYCCRHRTASAWNTLVGRLETGMKMILSEYFEIQIQRWELVGQRGGRVVLTSKQIRPSLQTPRPVTEKGKQPDRNSTQRLTSTMSRESQLSVTAKVMELEQTRLRGKASTTSQEVKPLLDWNMYRKLVVTKIRASGPSPQTLPNFANIPAQYSMLKRLGLVSGTRISIPSADYFVSITLRTSCPNRNIELVPRLDKPDRGYYLSPSPSRDATALQGDKKIQENKTKYFEHVIRQINPSARNIARQEMVEMLMDMTKAHVDSLVDTKALSEMDEEDMHPLFGKVRMRDAQGDGYRDLPVEAFTKGSRKLAQQMLKEYKRVGRELPEELKRVLDLMESNNDNDEEEKGEGGGWCV